jgi:hypothetical protein
MGKQIKSEIKNIRFIIGLKIHPGTAHEGPEGV